MAGKYIDIQNQVIRQYRITLCDGTMCKNDWSRTHAHKRGRKVCKWKQKNPAEATLELLHEIGHIENNPGELRRCEEEYLATQWAADQCLRLGVKISEIQRKQYQEYIDDELDRGLRCGGNNYPKKENLQVVWDKLLVEA